MYLIVNNSRLVLADPMSFEQFHVTRAAEINTARFAAPLTEQGAGRVVGNDVRVCTAWFRAQSIDDPWLTALDRMFDFAASKGSTDQKCTWVQAHVTTE